MRVLAAAVLLSLAFVASAQETFFSETVEVRVTSVDVVVTKNGQPVPGLTRDDFEVYEDGELQEISNFSEIQESTPAATLTAQADGIAPDVPAPPQPLRRRAITIFVDDAALHPLSRNAILPELRRFIADNVRPADSVMIVAWSSSLNVLLQPTSDRAAIDAAVEQLSRRTGQTGTFDEVHRYDKQIGDLLSVYADRDPPEKPKLSMAINIVSAWAERESFFVRRRVEALKSVISSLRGVDGRKILVVLTERLASNPGEEAFAYLERIRSSFESDHAGSGLTFDAKRYEIDGLVTEIAAAANSSGVTLYPIDGSGKGNDTGFADPSRTVRVVREGSALVPHTSTPALQAIAAETGGVATAGSTNWKLAFDTISSDLTTYYSLGYHTSGMREDRLRRITVKVKKKGYSVRTRRGVVEQTVSSEMQDAVAANLFRAEPLTNALGIRATATGNSVTITIPTETLTLRPDGSDLTGSFSLFAAFLRDDGAVSKVARQKHDFRFPAASLARRKEITVKLDVTADARTGGISLGVLDEGSRATGFASVKLAN
ncbi:MAG TPA: VWA domain-containing protein [Thermoanaerobaculia bacterium]